MSEFIVASTNSRADMGCALQPFARSLVICSEQNGGWGMGSYNRGEILMRMEPRNLCEPLGVASAMRNLEAEVFILHCRSATVGEVRRENTHPFRFQDWLFAHNGTLPGFEDYRSRIEESMPPFILRRVRGETDSEHLFHLFLSFLFDAGKVNRVNPGTEPIRDALAQAVSTVDLFAREGGHERADISVVVSDGYSVVALGRGIPVYYAFLEGLEDCENCRNSRVPSNCPSGVDHPELKAVLLRSGRETVEDGAFKRLEDSRIISITSDHKVEFNEFGSGEV